MNRIYRLVWNQVTNLWVCCAENAKGRGKSSGVCGSGVRRSGFNPTSLNSVGLKPDLRKRVLAVSLALIGTSAFAAPTGGQVSAGSGSIAQNGSSTTITQTSSNLAINWQSFGIAKNESVTFAQPNAAAIALNRVTGSNPSQILGNLSANGQVFILNPNGVLFGAGSQVNVGGLVASTLSLSDADFLAGKHTFIQNPSPIGRGAGVRGRTTANGTVVNQGTLTAAQAGYIALLAPEVRNEGVISATLGTAVLAAGNKITLNLNNGSLVSFTIDQGALNALADNKQLIQADGGQVFMSAKAADALSSAVVNNTGIIQARTIQNVAGVIKLIGDMEVGTVNVGGTLDASAPSPSASLHPLPAGEGNVQLPSPSGRGAGGEGANGGQIETSAAHVHIADNTQITTTAANGLAGTWLIDPVDFTIAATGGDITGAVLTANLAAGNVTILSTSGTVNTTTGLGDVNVNDAVSWSANLLTLNAQNNININAAMTASGTASLALVYGQGAVAAGNTSNIITGAAGVVNLPAGTTNFTTLQGSDGVVKAYTVITALGVATDATGGAATLQGMAATANLALNYALGADISAAGTSTWNTNAGFAPVGSGFAARYTGTFDGLGHTITGLTINRNNGIGLFGYGSSTSVIRNVGLVGGSMTGGTANGVGGLIGNSQGTISNSYATGNVSSTTGSYVGGLVGINYGTVSNSYATGNVSTTSGTGVGGLVGVKWGGGAVNNSYATGNVSGSGTDVGGLVGWNNGGAISNSYHTTGSVTGTGADVGGLVGLTGGGSTVTNSFYDMDVVTVNGAKPFNASGLYTAQFTDWKTHGFALNPVSYFGAATAANTYTVTGIQGLKDLLGFTGNAALTFNLAGNIDMTAAPAGFYIPTWAGTFDGTGKTISNFTLNSNASGLGLFGQTAAGSTIKNLGLLNVSVTGSTGNSVGGLVGMNSGTISNSYVTGTVSRTSGNSVGGLVGMNSGTISNSYVTGTVSSTSGNSVGGLAGSNYGTISNSYATGTVSTTTGINVGGLVGLNVTTITNSFFDMDVVTVNGAKPFNAYGLYTAQFTDWKTHGFALNPVSYFGTATAANTYTVTGVQGLKDLLGFTGNAALTFNLAGNIDMTSTPLPTGFYIPTWAGTFDGTGKTISNFTLNSNASNLGLFGLTAAGSTIKNLGLLNVSVTSGAGSNLGGLIGLNSGTISNSYATGNVSSTSGNNIGGLVGYNNTGTISNSYATGTVSSTSGSFVGGLVGYNNTGTISNSYATGNVNSPSGTYLGGLVGLSRGTISNSYATGSVSNTSGSFVGGLVGYEYGGTISNSYATGNVSTTSGRSVGGLVGYGRGGTISNSYATGNVRSTSGRSVGGLVGYGRGGTISNSYATGSVSGASYVGGLVGRSSGGTFTANFWDTTTSGKADGLGIGKNGAVLGVAGTPQAGVTGLTTAQMHAQASFTPAGTTAGNWDFTAGTGTWLMFEGTSNPLLRALMTSLTVTANNATKTYDGLAYNGSAGVTYSVTPNMANLLGTLSYTGGTNVGSYTITPGGLTSAPVQQGYLISYASGALTVNKANLAVTGLSASNKVYDATTAATLTGTAIVSALGSDVVTLGGTGTGVFANANVGTAKAVTVSGYTLSGAAAGNYTLVQPSGLTANITAANLSVTGVSASNKVYDTTTAATLGGTAAVAALGTDVVTLGGTGTGVFANANVGTAKVVSVSGYTLSGAAAGNYTLVQPSGLTANITAANLAVTGVTASNKVYDATTAATLTGTAIVSALGSDVVTLGGSGTGVFADANVGSAKAVSVSGYTLSGAAAGNYTLVQPSGLTADITEVPAAAVAATTPVTTTSAATTPAASTETLVVARAIAALSGGSNPNLLLAFQAAKAAVPPPVVLASNSFAAPMFTPVAAPAAMPVAAAVAAPIAAPSTPLANNAAESGMTPVSSQPSGQAAGQPSSQSSAPTAQQTTAPSSSQREDAVAENTPASSTQPGAQKPIVVAQLEPVTVQQIGMVLVRGGGIKLPENEMTSLSGGSSGAGVAISVRAIDMSSSGTGTTNSGAKSEVEKKEQ